MQSELNLRYDQRSYRTDLDTHRQHDCGIECRESNEKPLLALRQRSQFRVSVALCEATETKRLGRTDWTPAPVCLHRTHWLWRRQQWGGRRWQHWASARSLYDHCHWHIRFGKRDGCTVALTVQ